MTPTDCDVTIHNVMPTTAITRKGTEGDIPANINKSEWDSF